MSVQLVYTARYSVKGQKTSKCVYMLYFVPRAEGGANDARETMLYVAGKMTNGSK